MKLLRVISQVINYIQESSPHHGDKGGVARSTDPTVRLSKPGPGCFRRCFRYCPYQVQDENSAKSLQGSRSKSVRTVTGPAPSSSAHPVSAAWDLRLCRAMGGPWEGRGPPVPRSDQSTAAERPLGNQGPVPRDGPTATLSQAPTPHTPSADD